jgi:hypothetical protein
MIPIWHVVHLYYCSSLNRHRFFILEHFTSCSSWPSRNTWWKVCHLRCKLWASSTWREVYCCVDKARNNECIKAGNNVQLSADTAVHRVPPRVTLMGTGIEVAFLNQLLVFSGLWKWVFNIYSAAEYMDLYVSNDDEDSSKETFRDTTTTSSQAFTAGRNAGLVEWRSFGDDPHRSTVGVPGRRRQVVTSRWLLVLLSCHGLVKYILLGRIYWFACVARWWGFVKGIVRGYLLLASSQAFTDRNAGQVELQSPFVCGAAHIRHTHTSTCFVWCMSF